MIPILYQDDSLLAVDKPHDVLTTPGRGPDKQDCLINRLLPQFPNARIIHRLDMATSGIVILALSHAAQVAMGHLFEKRLINKTYTAIVDGKLDQLSGEIDKPLICDWESRPIQKVCFDSGKAALTYYKSIGYDAINDWTRVSLEPKTGRSHQLRVHMLSLGHPIIGDFFYAPKPILAKSSRLLLHANQLSFQHPFLDKKINLQSKVPF
jgi:tRNA pseudouridine32 synthase/23S rRNA pseudouridine746 synthase